MTAPGHDELKELAPAYVLGALDGPERQAFEAHLAICDECAALARSLGPVTGGLALAVPQLRPSAALRARVLAEAAPGQIHDRPSQRSSDRSAIEFWLPMAAMLALTAGIGLYALRLNARVMDLEVRLEQAVQQTLLAERTVADARRVAFESQSAMAVLAAADLARIDLAGQTVAPAARGRALWSREWGMVFAASQLPALPEGKVYQVWVITAQPAPISAGLLTLDANGGAVAVFATPADIPQPVTVAVTIEPAGGVRAPTGAMYLVGNV